MMGGVSIPASGVSAAALIVLGVSIIAGAAVPAAAQTSGTIGTTVEFNDNVFDLPAGVTYANGRGDRIYELAGALDVRQKLGDVDLHIDANAQYQKYDANSAFDNFNYMLRAKMKRAPDQRAGFDITLESDRRLSSFANLFTIQRNIQQFTDADARVFVPVTGEISMVAKGDFRAASNSSQLFQVNDFRRYGGGAGLAWYSPLGNILELTVDYDVAKGTAPRLVTIGGVSSDQRTDLTDISGEMLLQYAISPLSSIRADVAYVHRRDHTALAHDRDGPFGEISFDYRPRASFVLIARAGRRQETLDSLYIDSLRDNYAGLEARIRVLGRLDINASILAEWRRYFADPVIAAAIPDHSETDGQLTLGGQYPISDRFTLGGQYIHYFRNSSLASANYSANVFDLTLSMRFGAEPTN